MKKLPKLSVMDYTIPAGNICKYPSKAEANLCFHQQAAKLGISFNDVILVNIEVPTLYGFRYLAWCTTGGKETDLILPAFDIKGISPNILMNALTVNSGEVFLCGNLFYRVCDDPVYRQILRQIDIFADEDVIGSSLRYLKKVDDEPMEFYLVNVTNVNEPHKTVCYAWLVIIHHDDDEGGDSKQLFPVFSDELPLITNKNIPSLNWTFLHDGDCFRKDNTVYKFCHDDNHKAYIARLMSVTTRLQPSD